MNLGIFERFSFGSDLKFGKRPESDPALKKKKGHSFSVFSRTKKPIVTVK